ncbi:MAG: DinB family protein [bacterium]
MEKRLLHVQPLPGFDPQIGTWLWAMQQVRRRTLRLVDGLDQRVLDWEGLDERENAIGTLLYHIADGEMGWLFGDLLLQPHFPERVKPDFPYPPRGPDKRLTPVLGEPLESHLGRLARSRKVFLETFKEIPAEEWRRLRHPEGEDYAVTPEWAVFHLIEHEAGHAFQISSLKARAGRHFGPRV